MTERSRTYTYDIRPVDLQAMAGMSGLEYIQKIFARELPGATIAHTLAFYPVEVELGRAVFGGEPSEFVYNPIGSALKVRQDYTTVELKVNYVRAMTDKTGPVLCEGKVIHVGNSLATAEARLYGRDDGKLYAHGSTTCMVFKMPTRGR